MNWRECSKWLEERRDIWFDLLRAYLGVGLFVRGLILWGGGSSVMIRQIVGDQAHEWFFSAAVGHYVAMAHTAGGFLLAFGLLTRIAALVQVPILVGAVIAHAPGGLFSLGQNLEFSALVLVTLLIIAAAGPGRLSVDYYTFGPGRRGSGASGNPAPAGAGH